MLTVANMAGKVAIVTGAASGLGKATALKLAAAGAKVAIVDIDSEALQLCAKEIATLGSEALPLNIDLSDASILAGVIDATKARFGRLDALCNIAAVFLPSHSTEVSSAQWNTSLAVNLSAPFHLIQAAIPHLLKTSGAVVNVSSCAAEMGQAYLAAYSASKAGLNQLTKSLAMEYMHESIRFNAVSPGGMLTPLAAGLRNLSSPDPSLLSRISPLRGLVDIDSVADLVAFLASDAASSYHGAIINIDNGITVG